MNKQGEDEVRRWRNKNHKYWKNALKETNL